MALSDTSKWVVMAAGLLVACGGGSAGPDDAAAPVPCPSCQLTAVRPALARAGDTLTLEGSFAGDVGIRFADGEVVAATVLGPHRATVLVTATVTAGDVSLVAGTTETGRQPFRRISFGLAMAPFETTPVTIGTPRTAPVLATPSFGAASLVVGSALYVIGGADGPGDATLDTIDRALINADGSINAFRRLDGKLSAPRRFHTVTTIGERVYAIGGQDILASGLDHSVEQATIGTDGSLGAFANVPDVRLSVPRDHHTSTVIGNQLYVIGGIGPGGALAGLERAEIRPDGSLSSFTRVADVELTQPRSGHTSAVIGNSLYVFGGSDEAGGPMSSVERADIHADGSLGAFAKLDAGLFRARSGHTTAVLGDAVYVIGGAGAAGDLGNVERAAIQADGSLGAFAIVPELALATPRLAATSAIVRNYLYVIGGEQRAQPSVALASIERSSLISTDQLTVSKYTPPLTRLDFSGGPKVVIGNFSYEIGGLRGGVNQYDARIARAAYDANDELGAYEIVPDRSLTVTHGSHELAVIGPYLYVLAGEGQPTALAPTERAEILGDGSLGPFAIVGNPTNLRSLLDATIVDNTLYLRPSSDPMVRIAILPDGGLGPLVPQPVAVVDRGQAFGATPLALGRSLYLIGAFDGTTQRPLNNVARLPVGEDGALGSEVDTASLPHELIAGGAVVMGDQVYLLGGTVSASSGATPFAYTGEVQRATIHGDGSLSAFSLFGQYPELALDSGERSVVIGNYVYRGSVRLVIGGAR